MVSNFGEFYKLAQYLYHRTSQPVAVALGIQNLLSIFDESYYDNLDGGILEAFGRLFRNDMRLYVCPKIDHQSNELVSVQNIRVSNHLRHLYRHLMENDYLRDLDSIEHDYLRIHSKQVLQKIRSGDLSWMEMVPEAVARIINERGLFCKTPASKKL
jgi:hypothetical protein